MDDKYIPALLKCELFADIDKNKIKLLLSCLEPSVQVYTKNDFIVQTGEMLDGLGIILKGEASVFKDSLSGNRMLIKNISAGEMFGEVALFANKNEWPAIVQAKSPLTVCYISKERMLGRCASNCEWHNSMIKNMLEIVSKRAMMLHKKLDYISIKTMRSKLCTYIYEQYLKCKKHTIILPVNRSQLAEYLNVSRPSMSRELARMKDEGIIDYHLSTVKILDLERLKRSCE